MSNFPHGAFVAIHAAEKKRRDDEKEEEEMTNYSVDELDNNWEFKIVRSESGAFRKPEVFQRMLQEEQIAGWELVEKLDNRRVRLKRHKDARRKDAMLPRGYDPYRTNFGSSVARLSIILGVVFAMMLIAGLAVLGIASGDAGSEPALIAPVLVVTFIVVVLIATFAVMRRR